MNSTTLVVDVADVRSVWEACTVLVRSVTAMWSIGVRALRGYMFPSSDDPFWFKPANCYGKLRLGCEVSPMHEKYQNGHLCSCYLRLSCYRLWIGVLAAHFLALPHCFYKSW